MKNINKLDAKIHNLEARIAYFKAKIKEERIKARKILQGLQNMGNGGYRDHEEFERKVPDKKPRLHQKKGKYSGAQELLMWDQRAFSKKLADLMRMV